MNFAEIFGTRKLESLVVSCGVVCVILLAVSVEHRLVTDGRTDSRTNRHTTTAIIPALDSVARVKTVK